MVKDWGGKIRMGGLFENFLDKKGISAGNLEEQGRLFFETYGTKKLLGQNFFDSINIKGQTLDFDTLLKSFGCEKFASRFFEQIYLNVTGQGQGLPDPAINPEYLPKLYLYYFLEYLFPGRRLYRIKKTYQLVSLLKSSVRINAADEKKFQKVIDCYPVRLSDHVIRQSMVSQFVAGQYIPFVEELDTEGEPITFDGHFKQGVLEQMYENRVILLLDMRCPVFCRFCFRKHKEKRKEKTPGPEEIKKAIQQIKEKKAIREILITGGEPLINRPNIQAALLGINDVEHIRVIRIATRSVSYWPELFLNRNRAYIRYLAEWNEQLKKKDKRIEIGIHFVHPDEVSIQSLEIISDLIDRGIQVYLQTPFLNGLNTDGKVLARLFTLMRNAGVKIYYIFTPCSPIHGTKPYWTSISQAVHAYKDLALRVSDRCLPKLCTATPLGKIEWGTSGWAVAPDTTDTRFTWIRTPYTPAYYRQFVENGHSLPASRVNDEGTLDARFRVQMGEDCLFSGPRQTKNTERLKPDKRIQPGQLETIRSCLLDFSRLHPAGGTVHTLEAGMSDQSALKKLWDDSRLFEVRLHVSEQEFKKKGWIDLVKRIRQTNRVSYLRLNFPWVNMHPQLIGSPDIEMMRAMQDCSVGNPFRLEIETFFLEPRDISPLHEKTAKALIKAGINTYANVPLFHGLNDDPKLMKSLANQLRKAGIEFHMVIVSGLSAQSRFNPVKETNMDQVINIASVIRRSCSGRQIPLYAVLTPKGLEPLCIGASKMRK